MHARWFATAAAACLLGAGAPHADETGVTQHLVGAAAFGDWTSAAPGVERQIRPGDLPQPYATSSARNPSRVVRHPDGAALHLPPGFAVSAFATGFRAPRQMKLAPNGDVFIAESGARAIRVIRTAPGAERAGNAATFAQGLADSPYGLAFYPAQDPQWLYVATEGKVLRFPYRTGDLKTRGEPQTIVPDVPTGHHWTRDIVFTPDGSKFLLAVGSGDNDGEAGMAIEARRADILEYNPDGSGLRIFASGIRNPVTIGFYPGSDTLWTTVNERDGLGDNLPPDYVTRVVAGGFYGWPWYYTGGNQDPRHKGEEPQLKAKTLVPDVLLQPHSAPLGMAFYTGTQFPAAYRGNVFVALHGSWNRAERTGYKLVRIPVDNGKPTGAYIDFMTGFVTPDGEVWGRPVGLVESADGALLVSDDASGTIWRVSAAAPAHRAQR